MRNSERSLITLRGFPIYLLLVVLFIWLLRTKNRQKRMSTINEIYKTIYQFLIIEGFNYKQAQYITAQAAHETGNFTSDIYLNNKNLFGMKNAGQSLVIGTRKDHAVYASIEDSIRDYRKYYLRHNYLSYYETPESFVEALKREKYFEADLEAYKKGLVHFYNLYFNRNGTDSKKGSKQ